MKDALGDYLNAIGRYPLLTETEEIELSRQIQAMLPLREKDELTPKERHIVKRGERAFHKFYCANLRLPVHVARRYRRLATHMEFLDLIQEGTVGLSNAIEKFDYSRGYKFSTYAYWWIRQSITRALSQKDRLIRLPVHAIENLSKAREFMIRFRAEHGVNPSPEQMCEHLNITAETLKAYMHMNSDAVSLNTTAVDGETELICMIRDENAADQDDEINSSIVRDALDFMLAKLDPEDYKLMICLYGLDGEKVHTLQDYATKLGVSRERVRQRRNKALNKLMLANRHWHAMLSYRHHDDVVGNAWPSRKDHLRLASQNYLAARTA